MYISYLVDIEILFIYCYKKKRNIIYLFIFDMSTQEKEEGRYKLVTFIS
jgi:hypothetical protein